MITWHSFPEVLCFFKKTISIIQKLSKEVPLTLPKLWPGPSLGPSCLLNFFCSYARFAIFISLIAPYRRSEKNIPDPDQRQRERLGTKEIRTTLVQWNSLQVQWLNQGKRGPTIQRFNLLGAQTRLWGINRSFQSCYSHYFQRRQQTARAHVSTLYLTLRTGIYPDWHIGVIINSNLREVQFFKMYLLRNYGVLERLRIRPRPSLNG